MKVLTYGDIMDGGRSVFTTVAKLDGEHLLVSFMGVIRVENPHKELKHFLDELRSQLPKIQITDSELDFTQLVFCNSNGFYLIMEVTEIVYQLTNGPVIVRRLKDDDWQQETLPILLDTDEDSIAARTRFADVEEL